MMRFYVKTVHGISKANYPGIEFQPLFGTGQGSGASLAAWLILIAILLESWYRQFGYVCRWSQEATRLPRPAVVFDETANRTALLVGTLALVR